MALADDSAKPVENVFEGVDLLQTLIQDIIGKPDSSSVLAADKN